MNNSYRVDNNQMNRTKLNNTFYEGQNETMRDAFTYQTDPHEKDRFNQNIALWNQSGSTWRHSACSHKFP